MKISKSAKKVLAIFGLGSVSFLLLLLSIYHLQKLLLLPFTVGWDKEVEVYRLETVLKEGPWKKGDLLVMVGALPLNYLHFVSIEETRVISDWEKAGRWLNAKDSP